MGKKKKGKNPNAETIGRLSTHMIQWRKKGPKMLSPVNLDRPLPFIDFKWIRIIPNLFMDTFMDSCHGPFETSKKTGFHIVSKRSRDLIVCYCLIVGIFILSNTCIKGKIWNYHMVSQQKLWLKMGRAPFRHWLITVCPLKRRGKISEYYKTKKKTGKGRLGAKCNERLR